MAKFNVDYERKLLLNEVGGYEWSLANSFEEAKEAGGLGGSADSKLCDAVRCLIVGFDEPAHRLLKRAVRWVQVAIESDERPDRYFPGGTEASRFETLALCNWLIHDRHDFDRLQQFVANMDRCLNSDERWDKIEISLTLLSYVDAEAFERALEIFGKTRGLSPPTSLLPRNEAQMAYIVCRNRLGLEYSADDVRTAAAKFLKKNINRWLIDGHSVRAAQWLKILHWNDTDHTLSAKQVLLKAYDYLPACHPPA